jgi:hypothetical protein
LAHRNQFFQELMDEHIYLPGCPQIVVTRGWAYSWLRDKLGWNPSERGFGSLDYVIFRPDATNEPLTELTGWAADLIAHVERTENAC